ncbi:MAG: GNAT family N-acetyltransferase [Verrucomicrobiota bacterium]
MYKPKWIQYTWNLSSLPDESEIAAIKGDLRLAEKSEFEACSNILKGSLMTERASTDDLQHLLSEFEDLFPKSFERETKSEIVVWEDGRRLVGLSTLNLDPDSRRQLVSGVCVLEEYRCRGGGKALLLRSLNRLKEHGLETASVVTRQGMSAAKFLYPKFYAQNSEVEELPAWEVEVAK